MPTGRRFLIAVALAATLLGGLFAGRYVVPIETMAVTDRPAAEVEPSPADIGFSQDMTTHHAQAIRMAASVRGRVSPEIEAVAAQVFESQVQETGVLQGWLQIWGAPQLPSGPAMSWMEGFEAHGEHGGPPSSAVSAQQGGSPMPGMALQEEVNRLDDLSGVELEAQFLQLMVRHHQGGIVMAQAAAELAGLPAVRSLAAVMALQQQNEVTVMLQLLDARSQPMENSAFAHPFLPQKMPSSGHQLGQ